MLIRLSKVLTLWFVLLAVGQVIHIFIDRFRQSPDWSGSYHNDSARRSSSRGTQTILIVTAVISFILSALLFIVFPLFRI